MAGPDPAAVEVEVADDVDVRAHMLPEHLHPARAGAEVEGDPGRVLAPRGAQGIFTRSHAAGMLPRSMGKGKQKEEAREG